MQSSNAIDLYKQLWQRFQTILAKQHLAHALLLVGLDSSNLVDFTYAMSAAIFCAQQIKPCGECKSCRLTQVREHPDISFLEPEKLGSAIKIDQIRDLHSLAYRSPQLGDKRIIILYSAEKMNAAAANALLKLLEEPPNGVYFFLIAEQISTMPVTIISRCQQWRFMLTEPVNNDYLSLAQRSPRDSVRGTLFSQLPQIIDDLSALQANQVSICALAEKWSSYELHQLVWLFYLINCQLIDYKFRGVNNEQSWTKSLFQLAQCFHPIHLFRQLDRLNDLSKKLQQNINVNQLLAVENLLLGYFPP